MRWPAVRVTPSAATPKAPTATISTRPCGASTTSSVRRALLRAAGRNTGRRPRIPLVHAGRDAADERGGLFRHAPPGPEHHPAERIRRTGRAGRADRRPPGIPPRRTGRNIEPHHPPLRPPAENHRRPRPRARPRAARGAGEDTHQETAHQQHQPRAEDPRGGDSGLSGNTAGQSVARRAKTHGLPGKKHRTDRAPAPPAGRHLDHHAHGRSQPADPEGARRAERPDRRGHGRHGAETRRPAGCG